MYLSNGAGLNLANGSILNFDVNTNTDTSDLLAIAGTLNLSQTATVNVTDLSNLGSVSKFILATYNTTLGLAASNFTFNLPAGYIGVVKSGDLEIDLGTAATFVTIPTSTLTLNMHVNPNGIAVPATPGSTTVTNLSGLNANFTTSNSGQDA